MCVVFFLALRVPCAAATTFLAFDCCQTVTLPSNRHCLGSTLRFLVSIFLMLGKEQKRLQWFYIACKKAQQQSHDSGEFVWVMLSRGCPHPCSLDFSLGAFLSQVLSHPQVRNQKSRNHSRFALSKCCCFPLEYSCCLLDFFDYVSLAMSGVKVKSKKWKIIFT